MFYTYRIVLELLQNFTSTLVCIIFHFEDKEHIQKIPEDLTSPILEPSSSSSYISSCRLACTRAFGILAHAGYHSVLVGYPSWMIPMKPMVLLIYLYNIIYVILH